MPKILKMTMICLLAGLLFCLNIYAEENILNRLFFEDFENLGSNITVNPLKSVIIAGSIAITTGLVMDNDKYFLHEIEASKNKFNDIVFNFFNNFGDGVYILAADSMLFALGGDNERKTAKKIIEAVAVSGVISYVAKVIAGRERPSTSSTPYTFKMFSFSDSSLPSGHTTAAFAWATILGDSYDIGYITYPVAFLCGIARIYKDAHWPSDVLFGAFIGIVTGKSVNFENQNISISIKNKDNLSFTELNIKF